MDNPHVQPPILVVDTRGEISIFATPGDVEAYLEAPDVRDGEFRLFDSAGVEYFLSAESDASSVQVGPAMPGLPRFDYLAALVTDFLTRIPERKRRHPQDIQMRSPDDVRVALAPYVMD